MRTHINGLHSRKQVRVMKNLVLKESKEHTRYHKLAIMFFGTIGFVSSTSVVIAERWVANLIMRKWRRGKWSRRSRNTRLPRRLGIGVESMSAVFGAVKGLHFGHSAYFYHKKCFRTHEDSFLIHLLPVAKLPLMARECHGQFQWSLAHSKGCI